MKLRKTFWSPGIRDSSNLSSALLTDLVALSNDVAAFWAASRAAASWAGLILDKAAEISDSGQGVFDGLDCRLHVVVEFGGRGGGQLVRGESGHGGGVGVGQAGGGQGRQRGRGGEDVERIVCDGAAQFLGLVITPLVAGLGLELGGEGTVVLGLGHLGGGQAGEHGGDDGHHDGRHAENLPIWFEAIRV